MSTQQIKAKAVELFREARFLEALETLWKMDADEFILYVLNVRKASSRPDWLLHETAGALFWDEFVLRQDVFPRLFQSAYSEDLLLIYFKKSNRPGSKLLPALAENFPEVLLATIRASGVFLKKEWTDALSAFKTIPGFDIHVKTWAHLQTHESELWQHVLEKLSALPSCSVHELLAEVTIWLEQERFKSNEVKNIHRLARVYSLFVEKLLPLAPLREQKKELTEDEFFTVFLSRLKTKRHEAFAALLGAADSWLYFYERIVEPYIYGPLIRPVEENEALFFRTSPEYHYASLVDGVRYEIVQSYYHTCGAELAEALEREGLVTIPKGSNSGDEERNRALAGLMHGTLLLLDDLCINSFTADTQSLTAAEFLSPLITYSINRRVRYEEALMKHSASSSGWEETYWKVQFESIAEDIQKHPFVFTGREAYAQLNERALGISQAFSEQIIGEFGYDVPDAATDRFIASYDVWNNPFLRIGNSIFCPVLFFSSNGWFFSFAQHALLLRRKSREYNKEITQMEDHLGKQFQVKGWATKIITEGEAQQINGDADLIVEDETQVLLIQLKRTYLRLNLRDSYSEARMIDRKAADQLVKAEQYFRSRNRVYELKKPVTRWIVSTSLENIHTEIKGCRKINYFELLMALRSEGLASVGDLVRYMHSDKHLAALIDHAQGPDIPEEEAFVIRSLGLPIRMFEAKAYSQLFTSDDFTKTAAYAALYNEALEHCGKGEKNKAIELFHRCTTLNPFDAEPWGALANTLSDVRQFGQAFHCFEKTLLLLPGDPFTLRNYAFARMEAGQYFKGLMQLIGLYEKYPLMEQLKLQTMSAFVELSRQGVFSEEEFAALAKKLAALCI